MGVAQVPRAAVPGGRGAGEIIEVYPGATLRTMGLASYKSRPDEAVRLSIAACATAGIKLEIELGLIALGWNRKAKTPASCQSHQAMAAWPKES